MKAASLATPVLTSAGTISGAKTVGSVLTVTGVSYTGENATLTYRWTRNGANISKATNAKYVVRSADAGAQVARRTTVQNSIGSATGSTAAVTISLANPVLTSAGTISGAATVGSVLTVTGVSYTGENATLTYRWTRNGSDISGATNTTYVLQSADADAQVARRTTVQNSAGSAAGSTAAVTVSPTNPVLTSAGTISGAATVGSVLTVTGVSYTGENATLTYRWTRNGSDISGATSATYVLQSADAGAQVARRTTVQNSAGSAAGSTAAVTVSPINPVLTSAGTISGAATVGSVLTVTGVSYTGENATLTHRWTRNGSDISGATGATYLLKSADAGTNVARRTIVTNSAGSDNDTTTGVSVTAFASAVQWNPLEKTSNTNITTGTQVTTGTTGTPINALGGCRADRYLVSATSLGGARPSSGKVYFEVSFPGGTVVDATAYVGLCHFDCNMNPSPTRSPTRRSPSSGSTAASRRPPASATALPTWRTARPAT